MKTQNIVFGKFNTVDKKNQEEKLKRNLANSINSPYRTIPQRLLMTLKKTQHA